MARNKEVIIRSFIRVNYKIRVPKVRCVAPDGAMLGVLAIEEALNMARQHGLDLVEISPNADPPVCRIMDYGKYKYELSQKEKDARKRQHAGDLKEMKFHANVGDHDFETKVKHIREFLEKGNKVKVSLFFRGRENAHRELGFEVVNRVMKETASLCNIEMAPRLIGNSIFAVIAPRSARNPGRPASSESGQNTGRSPDNPVLSPALHPETPGLTDGTATT